MGVVNRRNALLGWVVWSTTKRMAKQKAKCLSPIVRICCCVDGMLLPFG